MGEDGVLVSSTSSIYIKSVKEKPSFIRIWVREISRYASSCLETLLCALKNSNLHFV